MKLSVTLSLDNAAFDDSGEASRILKDVADSLILSGVYVGLRFPIHDINGNNVGTMRVTK